MSNGDLTHMLLLKLLPAESLILTTYIFSVHLGYTNFRKI